MSIAQHAELVRRGTNISGLIRKLLADYLSDSTITLHVDPAARELYDAVVSQTDASNAELAAELRPILKRLLDRKLERLTALRRELEDD